MNKTIKFDKGISTIDFDTLKRSANYEQARGGLPKSRPIEHYSLLESICDKAAAIKGVNVVIDPIFCTEKQTLRVMWGGKAEECPIENHLIQRLTTRIQLIDKTNTDMNMAIGLSYNEKGITMAMGPNIWVCKNQNVFGDNLMSTYKLGRKDKLPFDKMIEVINAWITNYQQKKKEDYGKITILKNTIVDKRAVKLLYGELIEEAVIANLEGSFDAPMNVTQVGSFIRAAHSGMFEVEAGQDITAWDLTQMGTSVLNPNENDYTSAYQSLNNFNNYIIEKYSLN